MSAAALLKSATKLSSAERVPVTALAKPGRYEMALRMSARLMAAKKRRSAGTPSHLRAAGSAGRERRQRAPRQQRQQPQQ